MHSCCLIGLGADLSASVRFKSPVSFCPSLAAASFQFRRAYCQIVLKLPRARAVRYTTFGSPNQTHETKIPKFCTRSARSDSHHVAGSVVGACADRTEQSNHQLERSLLFEQQPY